MMQTQIHYYGAVVMLTDVHNHNIFSKRKVGLLRNMNTKL